MHMKIAIAGGSGFVGKEITSHLLQKGHEVCILTRETGTKQKSPGVTYVQWLNDGNTPETELDGIDCFINLAGESLNSGRWTKKRKEQIKESRITAAHEMVRILKKLKRKPKVVLNASAIGYYGTSLTDSFDESDRIDPSDFLSETVTIWEAAAAESEMEGIRTVYMRFGVILGKEEGALPRMALPYKLFAGGTIGSGEQWLSWIHIEDVARAAIFCMEQEDMKGPVNFTAPSPATMSRMGKAIGKALRRPHWMPVPSFMLKAALGEMSILILQGQKVFPSKLLKAGYQFAYPGLDQALDNIFR